jgi:hypothetical protein
MVRRTSRNKPETVVTVDFKGVEGKRTPLPEGDYVFRVKQVTKEPGEKADQLVWIFTVEEGPLKGRDQWYRTSLSVQSLWNLRNLLETLGVEIPDGPLDIDLPELVDATVGGTIIHEEYQGKPQSRIADFYPLDDEPEEKSGKSADKSGKKGNSLEKLKADDVTDMDEDELKDIVKKYKLDVDLDEHKTLRKKANIVIDKLEAADYIVE